MKYKTARKGRVAAALGFTIATMAAAPGFAATPTFGTPTVWTTTIDSGVTGSTGTITFNDWGYKGPTGVGANDFQVGSGFNSSQIGQIQHVVTTGPDWNTPDPAHDIVGDLDYDPNMPNANMDSGVNFYKWGYTTVAGSTFNNMQIDKAGNYHVAKNDMSFHFYDIFQYKNGTADPTTYDTKINFQPYAISDAKGWCGSVLNSNPNGLAFMAGQVTFDFAFDAFLFPKTGTPGVIAAPGADTQIVPGFVMRSYGSYEVNVDVGGDPTENQHFYGSAVMNNTNPLTGQLDPNYHNKVSFLGAGVVPLGVWVINDGTPNVQVVPEGTPGATWHANSFGGFAFLMRADADRTLEWINPNGGHSDYVATDAAAYTSIGMAAPVPLPAAVWLMGSGLMGLVGIARHGKKRVVV